MKDLYHLQETLLHAILNECESLFLLAFFYYQLSE